MHEPTPEPGTEPEVSLTPPDEPNSTPEPAPTSRRLRWPGRSKTVAEAVSPPSPDTGVAPPKPRLKVETRVGLVTLLSFLALVAALVAYYQRPRSGKHSPTLAMDGKPNSAKHPKKEISAGSDDTDPKKPPAPEPDDTPSPPSPNPSRLAPTNEGAPDPDTPQPLVVPAGDAEPIPPHSPRPSAAPNKPAPTNRIATQDEDSTPKPIPVPIEAPNSTPIPPLPAEEEVPKPITTAPVVADPDPIPSEPASAPPPSEVRQVPRSNPPPTRPETRSQPASASSLPAASSPNREPAPATPILEPAPAPVVEQPAPITTPTVAPRETPGSEAGWVALPNLGKHRRPQDGPLDGKTAANLAMNPARPEPDEAPIQPVLHAVRQGETFGSIARQYYGTDRYARALWSANRRQVPEIDRLSAGTTIRVPPPESYNTALVDPPRADVAEPAVLPRPRAEVARRDGETALASGPREAPVLLPTGRPSRDAKLDASSRPDDLPDRPAGPKHPVYTARRFDTFRSIARDTLGDSDRADEIRQLNLDAITNPARPSPGQKLRLPLDAKLK